MCLGAQSHARASIPVHVFVSANVAASTTRTVPSASTTARFPPPGLVTTRVAAPGFTGAPPRTEDGTFAFALAPSSSTSTSRRRACSATPAPEGSPRTEKRRSAPSSHPVASALKLRPTFVKRAAPSPSSSSPSKTATARLPEGSSFPTRFPSGTRVPGFQANAVTGASWLSYHLHSLPETADQTRRRNAPRPAAASGAAVAVTIRRPHGAYDTRVTAPASHRNVCAHDPGARPVMPARSHTFPTPSPAPPPEHSCHPAGWNATDDTVAAWRRVGETDAAPVTAHHTRTVPSTWPAATRRPDASNACEETWPSRGESRIAGETRKNDDSDSPSRAPDARFPTRRKTSAPETVATTRASAPSTARAPHDTLVTESGTARSPSDAVVAESALVSSSTSSVASARDATFAARHSRTVPSSDAVARTGSSAGNTTHAGANATAVTGPAWPRVAATASRDAMARDARRSPSRISSAAARGREPTREEGSPSPSPSPSPTREPSLPGFASASMSSATRVDVTWARVFGASGRREASR